MKRVVILCAGLLCLPVAAQKKKEIRAATYNLRVNNPSDGINSWPNRKEDLKALILYHDFDIFGTQEGLAIQLDELCEMQKYALTGSGRIDGRSEGEHCAIFYKTERFKLLEAGDFWLSETPDKPSKGWDAYFSRICSWAKFKDANTKTAFYFFSVHFDHKGVVARRESGKLMIKKIREIAGNAPVICVGDFNSTPETEQIKTMQALLNDSRNVTVMPPYGPEGTFNGFRFDAPMNSRIDYIFVSSHFSVLKYAVLTDAKNQRYPSDHQPVVVDLAVKRGK